MNQNNFSFEVTNAVIASFCVLGDFVMIQSYFFEVMNAVIARVLDCFYLMEHSMMHQNKCSLNIKYYMQGLQEYCFLHFKHTENSI